MKLNNLEKAAKILTKIKSIDAEIIQIEKRAMLVADSEVLCSFEMNFEKKDNPKEPKVIFDEDGSIIIQRNEDPHPINMSSIFMNPFMGGFKSRNDEENENILKYIISPNVALQVLGVLLYEKKRQREILLNKMKSLGITI